MKLSPRLTRAGLAFLVFGMLASTLPSGNGLVFAANCPSPSGGGGNNTGAVVAAAAVGGGLFALSRTGGGLFPYAPGRKKKKRNHQEEQFNRLDRFTRPSDAGSNPGINH